MSIKKFPPKFDQSLLYPAIYNLDEYDMPNADESLGVYFDINFPNYGTNIAPTLTYGKHRFDVYIKTQNQQYNLQGYPIGDSLPPLKNGSRILMEFKDAAGTVIFSDYTSIHHLDGFTGYVWIKQDPMRTYNDIIPGWGKMTIVGIAETTDRNWKNRYNVRSTHWIDIILGDGEGGYYPNYSPIVFQANTGSIGSGSGLTMEETLIEIQPEKYESYLTVSASKLKTFSGTIDYIRTYIKISQSGVLPEWEFFADNPLTSSNYEDTIYKDYGQGLNTLSEKWSRKTDGFLWNNADTKNRVKFKLEFRDPSNLTAKNPYDSSGVTSDYILQYPDASDTDSTNGWMTFQGSDYVTPAESSGVNPDVGDTIVYSSAGQFNFNPDVTLSTPDGTRGWTYEPDGTPIPPDCNNPPCGGGGGDRKW